MISESNLKELGFVLNKETPESSGTDFSWHYYTLDINDFCLISSSSDEVKDNNWKVFIFDYNGFEITTLDKLKSFINILNSIKR